MGVLLINDSGKKVYNGFYIVGEDKGYNDLGGSLIFYNPNKNHFMCGTCDTWGNCKAFAYWSEPIVLSEETQAGVKMVDSTYKNKAKIESLLMSIPHERRGEDYIYLNSHYANISEKHGLNIYTDSKENIWKKEFPILEELETLTNISYGERTIGYPCPR